MKIADVEEVIVAKKAELNKAKKDKVEKQSMS